MSVINMITKTLGIVLNNSDYKEYDILVTIISQDYGLITLVAKGAKKFNSKNRHCIMPFTISEFIFEYYENKNIFNLQKSNFIKSYYKDDDLLKISAMNVISDISRKYLHFENNLNFFNDIRKCFDLLNNNDSYKVMALFMAKVLKYMGLEPYVDGCIICNESKVVSFSNKDGGFLCRKHAHEFEIMDVEKLKKIRLINKMDYEHFDYLNNCDYKLDDFNLMANFFIDHSGYDIKSYRFYKSLLS